MRFRSFLKLSAAAGMLVSANTGLAADLPPPPPPPNVEVVPDTGSCVYVRIDGGGSFHQRPKVTKTVPVGGAGFVVGGNSATDETLANHAFVEGGIGCQVNENFRVEVTGGYRFKASLKDPFNSLDADLDTATVFANVYYDITNYNGFTPYVGGGVGIALHRLSNVTLPVDSSGGGSVQFAWNVTTGISYDITDSFKLDVAYRFVDLGTAKSGGPVPMYVADLYSHEVKVGLRYHFNGW